MTILADLSQAELLAKVAELQAANEKLKAGRAAKATLKVGPSGTVCLYGLGRYPVALYRSQWERLISIVKSGEVEAFMEANADRIAVKG